jgi:quercetin dioxygenase-like cupin family protein
MKRVSFVVRPEDVPTYAPAGAHKGTVNRRLISGQNLELILGEIAAGGVAEPHYHDPEEQAIYLLEGKCLIEIEGKSQEMHPGQAAYFAPGQLHKVVPIGGPIRVIVVYAPPLPEGAGAFKSPTHSN